MIEQIKSIPITERSYPLTRAALKCDFVARSYVEEEYFFSGTANVYEEQNGGAAVKYTDAPLSLIHILLFYPFAYLNSPISRRRCAAAETEGRKSCHLGALRSGAT